MEELDEQLWARFQALREHILAYINEEVAAGTFHKSYEGRMEVSFCYPSAFQDSTGEHSRVRIHLWCYLLCHLLCQGRECEWEANSFQEALIKAERDIYRWIGTAPL